MKSFSLSLLAVVVSSCGLGSQNARCDMRPKTAQCTDWRNNLQPVWTPQEALCKTLGGTETGGTFTAGATCDTTDMWGGCQVKSLEGSLQTNWYYKSESYKTLEAAKAECSSNMSFVDPK